MEQLVTQGWKYYEFTTGRDAQNRINQNRTALAPVVRGKQYTVLAHQPVLSSPTDISFEKSGLVHRLQYVDYYVPVHLNDEGFIPKAKRAKFEYSL